MRATKWAAMLWGLAAGAQLWAAGCGGSDEGHQRLGAPPPNNSQPWDGPAAAYVRVDVALAAGVPHIRRASRVTTPPLPPALGGELMAVAWADDGTIIDAAPVRLATVSRSAGFDGLGQFVESEQASDPASASASVFLLDHPALERIEILDASGAAAATVLAGDIEAATLRAELSHRTSAITLADIQSTYPWVQVLTPADAGLLPTKLAAATTGLVQPTSAQLDLIDDCLTKMTEASRRSVVTIAVGALPNHGVTTLAAGCQVKLGQAEASTMLINADMNDAAVTACIGSSVSLRFINTCVHEAAHNFTDLVAAAAVSSSLDWPVEAQQLAQEKIQSYGLSAGLDGLFASLQATAVAEADLTKATAYLSDGGAAPASDALAVRAGFATAYGAKNPFEDIAEYVSDIQAPRTSPGTQPEICNLFAQAGVLSELTAIQYAKALLMRNIGLIDVEPFAGCVHGFGIDARPGISAPDSDFQFTGDLDFGYFDLAGERMFGVAGDGADTYQALLRVKVTDGKPPLGLHRLDHIGYFDVEDAENGFLLANDDPFLARTSTGGLALITEITPHTTSGAIFFLGLGDLGIGIFSSQSFPVVTFRVSK